ncbi:Six-hairpin glycosidase-like protein [Xylariaceae sp. FL0016]|nr:Six-hairpin glycosidase-like protein [Xylariaceae sp. FL0016]
MMSAQLQQQPTEQKLSSDTNMTHETKPAAPSVAEPLRNRAGDPQSKSPYVRAHADSLVAWQLLDDKTISRAKNENKPIFLSIGYLASHHCYLARQESFANPKIASLLNQEFIPVLIDREEYPAIDSLYLSYNQFLTNSAGWPLNVFLTPELEPFYSGTYFAPPGTENSATAEAEGVEKPLDWLTVVKKVHSSWKDEESRVRDEARENLAQLRQVVGEGSLDHPLADVPSTGPPSSVAPENSTTDVDYLQGVHGELDLDQIEEAYERITRTFDTMFGGFGQQDKFLTPLKLSLLLRATQFPKVVQDVVGPKEVTYISAMGLHTLRRIVNGAVHDHVGGGFHRYSITRDWSLPSFEKMLIDNALLLGLFLDAWLLSGGTPGEEFASTVLEVADYITSDRMLSEKGGFYTSEMADSYEKRGDKNMQNGAFYLWTRKEFDTAVGDDSVAEVAAAYWDVDEDGNVERTHDPHDEFLNQNVIKIVKNYARLSKQLGISEDEVKQRIDSAREKLWVYRQKERVPPGVDTKIVTAYNGMAIAALARTANALAGTNKERCAQYMKAAQLSAQFIESELWDSSTKTLYRVYIGDQRCDIQAVAEDYAFLIEGLIELYEVTAKESYLEWADELQETQIRLFYDQPATAAAVKSGGFFSTTGNAKHVLLRNKEAMDGSQPSANAVSVSNLFRLGSLLRDDRYTYLAKASVNAFGIEMLEHPNLFPGLLCGIVPWKLGGKEWVICGEQSQNTDEEVERAVSYFRSRPRADLFTLRWFATTDPWLMKRAPLALRERGVYVRDRGAEGGYRRLEETDFA